MTKLFKDDDRAVREAKEHSQAVAGIDNTLVEAWWSLGKHTHAVYSRKLWEALELKSFGAWLDQYVKASRKTAYDAMKSWEALREVPEATRLKIPKQNAKILARMPESRRKAKKWITAAIEMKEQNFKALVNESLVGAEKKEDVVTKHFHFEESQWEVVGRGLDHLKNFHGVLSAEEGLEVWAADYLAGVNESETVQPTVQGGGGEAQGG